MGLTENGGLPSVACTQVLNDTVRRSIFIGGNVRAGGAVVLYIFAQHTSTLANLLSLPCLLSEGAKSIPYLIFDEAAKHWLGAAIAVSIT